MLFNHTVVYALARGIPALVNFLMIIFLTRLLSPEQYGLYALVIAIVAILNEVFFQWIRLGLLRFLNSYSNNNQRRIFLSTIFFSFLVIVAITFVCGCLGFIICISTDLDLSVYWMIGICLLWVQAWYDLNLTLLRTELSPIKYAFLSLVKAVLVLVFSLLFTYLGMEASGVLVALVLGMGIPLLAVFIREWKGVEIRNASKDIFRRVFNYGLPLTITFAMATIIQGSDRILLSLLASVSDTGLYSVSHDLSQQTIILIMLIINLGGFPLVLRSLEKNGYNAAFSQLKKNGVAIMLVAIPSTAGFILLTPNISYIFLGSKFQETSLRIMPLIAFAALLQGVKTFYFDLSFQLGERTKLQIIPVLIGAIINILLNLIFIPKWGAVGAAFTTIISYLISLIISWQIGQRIFRLPIPIKEFIQIIAITIMMCIVIFPLSYYKGLIMFGIQVTLGVIVYLIGLILFDVSNTRKAVLMLKEGLSSNKQA